MKKIITLAVIMVATLSVFMAYTHYKNGNDYSYDIQDQPLVDVESWVYQLQDADPDLIASSDFDLIVMDYSADGTEENKYTLEEINNIEENGIIPIAYISIGEAEDYRFYWQDEWNKNPPSWLGKENTEWVGNYKVKYWEERWKTIVKEYLDKVINQGFLGVYLDIIDGFEYWSDPDNGEDIHPSEKETAGRMIDFLVEIASYCRDEKGKAGFYIIPQNGERILDYDADGSYLETISGIGVESIWYDGITPLPSSDVEERIQYLDDISGADKVVFSVDYVDDGTGYFGENKHRIDDYLTKASNKGYISYVARSDFELDELNNPF